MVGYMAGYDEQQVIAFIDEATALYARTGRTPDPHALVWLARMQFDSTAMGYQASRAKHRAELVAALGLPAEAPAPIANPFALPRVNLYDLVARRGFIRLGITAAYGTCSVETENYWMGEADGQIDRGIELGEGNRYFWERLLGRGAGGDDVAKFGPYAGLVEFQGSLTTE